MPTSELSVRWLKLTNMKNGKAKSYGADNVQFILNPSQQTICATMREYTSLFHHLLDIHTAEIFISGIIVLHQCCTDAFFKPRTPQLLFNHQLVRRSTWCWSNEKSTKFEGGTRWNLSSYSTASLSLCKVIIKCVAEIIWNLITIQTLFMRLAISQQMRRSRIFLTKLGFSTHQSFIAHSFRLAHMSWNIKAQAAKMYVLSLRTFCLWCKTIGHDRALRRLMVNRCSSRCHA